MNSQIIPQGPAETVTNATLTKEALLIAAETDLVISAIEYSFPATPPNAAVVVAFTLKQGRTLFNVRTVTFTGTATVIYTGRANK